MPKTETEKILEREIDRLETQVEDLKRKIKIANDFNHKYFKENEDLRFYIRQMEGNYSGAARIY
jgi:primosomal protein N''